MAKLTIVAEIDLNNGQEASDLLSSINEVLLDMSDECEHGHARKLANTSGVFKNDLEDEDEDNFGTWKWE